MKYSTKYITNTPQNYQSHGKRKRNCHWQEELKKHDNYMLCVILERMLEQKIDKVNTRKTD